MQHVDSASGPKSYSRWLGLGQSFCKGHVVKGGPQNFSLAVLVANACVRIRIMIGISNASVFLTH